MRLDIFDKLPCDDLISNYVLPAFEEHSKGGYDEGGNTDEDHIEQEEDGIFYDSE